LTVEAGHGLPGGLRILTRSPLACATRQ